jgi:sensor histidine kinase YesM
MLIQPFVENVFVYALDQFHSALKLNIPFEMLVARVLECIIIDNGKRSNAHKQSKLHASRGIALARERIMFLQPCDVDPSCTYFTEN